MRTTILLAMSLSLGLALVAGCALTSGGSTGADRELRLARSALDSGDVDLALLRLEKARMVYRGPNPEYVTLLMAEARLRLGEANRALAIASEVLEADGANPAANEVAGKALLKLARFDEAEERFLAAQGSLDTAGLDAERLDDLIRLNRGLAAYSKGDPDVANRYWEGIRDPQIRHSLDRAVRAVASM